MTTTTAITTNRQRVFITRQIPQEGLDMLLGRCNVSFWESSDPAPRAELLHSVPGCTVILCMPTDKIDRDILNAAGPSLKIVAVMAEDCDNIDTSECSRRNIRVLTLPPVTKETVAHIAVALLRLMTLKWMSSVTQNLNAVLQSKDIVAATKTDRAYCLELGNRTVGIVGMGPLGLSLAKTLRGLGVLEVLYNDVSIVPRATEPDIKGEFVGKDELLSRSDILFVCFRFEKEGTKPFFFDMDAYKKMKSSAILIDVTKHFPGDFGDLYEALRMGEIAAVGLDVREYEDIPNRHPLDMLENCFFLPYQECYKWDGRRKCASQLAGAILSALQEIDFAQKKRKPIKCCKYELSINPIPEVVMVNGGIN